MSKPRPLPRFTGDVSATDCANAFPGSPFGDFAWRVNSNVMAPRIDKRHIACTLSTRVPVADAAGSEDVVVVKRDGSTIVRTLVAENAREIFLKRWVMDEKTKGYSLGDPLTVARKDVLQVLPIVSKWNARVVREAKRATPPAAKAAA